MTPRRRFLSALDRSSVDRVPVMYQHLGAANHLQSITGRSIREGYHDQRAFAQLCEAAWKEFHHDDVMMGWGDLLREAQAFGVSLSFPTEGDYPRGEELSLEEVEILQPVDLWRDEVWAMPLWAAREMVLRSGEEVLVMGAMNDPFMVASALRGYENLLLDQMTQPELVHRLLRVVTDTLKEGGPHWKDFAGVEVVFLGDGLADAQQNDLRSSERFDISYAAELVRHLRACGLRVVLSNCTKEPYLREQITHCQPDAMHCAVEGKGYPDAIRLLQGRVCLVAGMSSVRAVKNGTAESIRTEVSRVVESYGTEGLMIATAGELPFDTPKEKVVALARSTM